MNQSNPMSFTCTHRLGKNMTCRKCKMKFRLVDHILCHIYVKGKINEADSSEFKFKDIQFKCRKRDLVWEDIRSKEITTLCFPCPICGSVQSTPRSDVGLDGFLFQWDNKTIIRPCITCATCQCHFWPYFDRYDG